MMLTIKDADDDNDEVKCNRCPVLRFDMFDDASQQHQSSLWKLSTRGRRRLKCQPFGVVKSSTKSPSSKWYGLETARSLALSLALAAAEHSQSAARAGIVICFMV
jgi:hypothetical protein